MGQAVGSDGGMAKTVACDTTGIWAPVPNDANLAHSLSTFNQCVRVQGQGERERERERAASKDPMAGEMVSFGSLHVRPKA